LRLRGIYEGGIGEVKEIKNRGLTLVTKLTKMEIE